MPPPEIAPQVRQLLPRSLFPAFVRGFAATLAMAAVYFVAGRLALLLAIPPGYATAVWPAAGLALAGVLRYGYRLSGGVWLGSFFVNICTSFPPGGSAAEILRSVAAAGGIAAGAALQASLGAFLIRRFAQRSLALDDGPNVVKFLTLGGPTACVVNAIVGVSTLFACGIVARAAVPFSVATWWVGDSIGVLIFAPLGMLLLRPERSAHSRLAAIAWPLSLMFAGVVTLFFFASRWEQERLNRAFVRKVDTIANALKNKVEDYLGALHSIAALYGSSKSIERGEFATFARELRAHYAGIEGLSWDPRVLAADRARFEAEVANDGFPGFQIREFDAHGAIVRAADRPDYFPIHFREPAPALNTGWGFDAASDPDRAEALRTAAETGRARATTARLFADPSARAGLIVYQPVYRQGAPHGTVEERRQNLQGYAAAVLRVKETLRVALRNLDVSEMEIRLSQSDPHGPSGTDEPHRGAAGPTRRVEIDLAGVRGFLDCALTSEAMVSQRSWMGWVVLAGGLVLTALLGGFLLVITGRSARIEELVTQRTAELDRANRELQRHVREIEEKKREILELNADLESRIVARTADVRQSEERLQTVIANLSEGLVVADLEGRLLHWNPAALAMHGFTNSEEWSRRLPEFLQIFELSAVDGTVLDFEQWPMPRLFRGEKLDQTEIRIRRIDHDWERVFSYSGSLVREPNGADLAFLTIADITARVSAEEGLRRLNADLEHRVAERTIELADSLAEKEVLLQEVHHRVKNNLQVVSGLLQLQAGKIDDPAISTLFQESENRVRTMALVHQALYQSDLANIDFGEYAGKLTRMLWRSFNVDPGRLSLSLETHGINVSADVAVPCGLIINELVTNSLKYAFAGRERGEVRVAMQREGEGRVALSVSDDGVGLPPGIDAKTSSTLGLRLVTNLAGQLDARLEHSNGVGTTWKIRFNSAA
jgi:PAS domain S-box-containing protein